MSFLALRKFWSWLKHYWYIPVILIGIAVTAVVLRRRPDALMDVLNKAIESHKKEVEVLNKAHEQEKAKREKALKTYQDTVSLVEEKYQQDQKVLEAKKKKKIKKLVDANADDPTELTKQISEVTGYEIVLPSNEK